MNEFEDNNGEASIFEDYRKMMEKMGEMLIKEGMKLFGKERGIVFDSLEDLKCGQHPEASFVPIRKTGLWPYLEGENLKYRRGRIYKCEECLKNEEEAKRAGKVVLPEVTTAYDCPNCGIVKGEPKQKHPREIEEFSEWGSSFCLVCESEIEKGNFEYIKFEE